MTNLHRDYKVEHDGVRLLETKEGFATYKVDDKTLCYMEVYVTPDQRGKGKAVELTHQVHKIARELGASQVIAMVDPNDVSAKATAGALMSAGMKKVGTVTVEFDMYRSDVCHG